jgi:hypothetical protein
MDREVKMLHLQHGEEVEVRQAGRQVARRVTEHDIVRVALARGHCAALAGLRATVLYKDLADLVGLANQGLGSTLDLLSEDCTRRGEPSLAALVINKKTGHAGDQFRGDDAVGREQCYEHWLQQRVR